MTDCPVQVLQQCDKMVSRKSSKLRGIKREQ